MKIHNTEFTDEIVLGSLVFDNKLVKLGNINDAEPIYNPMNII